MNRRDQIKAHLKVEGRHLAAVGKALGKFLWDLRGLIRAILNR